jgi:CheY-like chemotaxis protein
MAKILIVEDNEDNWDILSRRLGRRGYEIVLARDGQEGISLAESDRPDLILMDMNLPIIDGWEAAKRLKAAEATSGIPIIAVTAHGMSGDREKVLKAGCDDHHAKPVELNRLLEQIEAALGKSGSR